MEKKFIEIAESLLDASFAECEKALEALEEWERERVVAHIFKAYHKRSVPRACIKREKKIIPPVVMLGLSSKGNTASITYKGREKRGLLSEALQLAQAIRDIYGKDVNTEGADGEAVRRLVPSPITKRRVNICISATIAVV